MTTPSAVQAARDEAKALDKLCRTYRRSPTPELGAEIRDRAGALTATVLRLYGPDLDALGKIAKSAAQARGTVAREDWQAARR